MDHEVAEEHAPPVEQQLGDCFRQLEARLSDGRTWLFGRWTITDAYGYGPALWIAPVLDDAARDREVPLPRGQWIDRPAVPAAGADA